MPELYLPSGAEVGGGPGPLAGPLPPLAPGDPDGSPDEAAPDQPPPPGQEAPELSGLQSGALGQVRLRLVHGVQPPGIITVNFKGIQMLTFETTDND